jgi:surfeit locus 1 family protein
MAGSGSGHDGGDSRMRSRIILTLAALSVFAILIGLGVWQWQRRDWKNGLIARFEAALTQPPAAYDPAQAWEFMAVRVHGTFLDAEAVKMLIATPEPARAQTQDGFGYLLFTPLKFEGGIVFVNRGFVPQGLASSPALFPEGETEVTGIVRLAQQPGWFTPPADAGKRLFYEADIPAMAAAAGLKEGEAIVSEYIEAQPVPGAGLWPKARDPRELLASIPNRHLEYALTWFGLAAALAGVYVVYIVRT